MKTKLGAIGNFQIQKHLSIIGLIILLQSCSSFSKVGFRKKLFPLTKKNCFKLNGNYSYHPIREYYSLKEAPSDTIPDSLLHNNAYNFITKKKNRYKRIKYKKENLNINLKLLDKNKLQISVIDESKVLKDTTLTGECKNGMFYLDNEFLSCHGIPYILGGCQNNKRRLGLNKNGNLIVNKAISNAGAFLFIIGAGYSYNISYEYQKHKS